ncbi:MAG: carboxypeptidase-like regulatory domain-containing protein, partial [Candidatus Cloacimonetes bacterium]|nr:carboxypeptidase-like regulatory domain-containing protein [Candidatus Cloacimonadota bacterium]
MKKLIIICIFSICLCLSALEIKSRIVDSSGRGIAQATVKAGNSFAFSDAEGFFSLQTRADTLIVSRIGYQTRTVATATIGATIMLEADPV